ncbi:unnamed protein product [Ostreobium quekettii]|uniref:RING-type domain-containing protein n=1 Tax=Ostreobium quekettii TaxID=121088 RepID=A0A8S1J0B5_9CHLO|nr:unnamed protein product [Ostreobium quekettii]
MASNKKFRHRSEAAAVKRVACMEGDEGCMCPKCRFGSSLDSDDQEKRLNDIATWLCVGPDSEEEPTKQELKKWNKTALKLCKSAQVGNIEEMEELLSKQDCDDDIMTQISSELVIVASQFGKLEALKVLHESWLADLNYQSNRGRTERGRSALMYAASNGHVPVVRYLLEHEDVNIDCADEGAMTALMIAIFSNRNAVVQVLLEEGADVNVTDSRGRTALSHAAMFGNVDTINLLAEHGSSLYHQDGDGKTVLELAQCHNRCTHVVEAIKKCLVKEELRKERERRSKNKLKASQGGGTGLASRGAEQADQNMARLLRELEEEELSQKKKKESRKARRRRRSGPGLSSGTDELSVDGMVGGSLVSQSPECPGRSIDVGSHSPDRGEQTKELSSRKKNRKARKASECPSRQEPKAEPISVVSSWDLLNPHAQSVDPRELRAYWNVILEDANRCVEEEKQAQYRDLLLKLMQRCEEEGISVKQGKKVMGRLERVGGAREELCGAIGTTPVDLHRVDMALKDAKQVKNLIDPKLWAKAEALMQEGGAQFVQEREAVISSLVQLHTDVQANGHCDESPQGSPPGSSEPLGSVSLNGAPRRAQAADGGDTLAKDIECMVCLCARRSACIVPCGHICMCYGCAMEVQNKKGVCPLCRGSIDVIMEIL